MISYRKPEYKLTPKDSDALFALILGQVDTALVGEDNWKEIGKINPVAGKSVRVLYETLPIPLPVLCCRKGAVSAEKIEKIKELFVDAGETNNKLMEMLQIDGWQNFSD